MTVVRNVYTTSAAYPAPHSVCTACSTLRVEESDISPSLTQDKNAWNCASTATHTFMEFIIKTLTLPAMDIV
jgi:hypothetical protein